MFNAGISAQTPVKRSRSRRRAASASEGQVSSAGSSGKGTVPPHLPRRPPVIPPGPPDRILPGQPVPDRDRTSNSPGHSDHLTSSSNSPTPGHAGNTDLPTPSPSPTGSAARSRSSTGGPRLQRASAWNRSHSATIPEKRLRFQSDVRTKPADAPPAGTRSDRAVPLPVAYWTTIASSESDSVPRGALKHPSESRETSQAGSPQGEQERILASKLAERDLERQRAIEREKRLTDEVKSLKEQLKAAQELISRKRRGRSSSARRESVPAVHSYSYALARSGDTPVSCRRCRLPFRSVEDLELHIGTVYHQQKLAFKDDSSSEVSSFFMGSDKENRPTWCPDSACRECYHCRRSFTVRRRRHHCRHCGELFCGRCSDEAMPIPKLGYRTPQRVCNACCAVLQGQNLEWYPSTNAGAA